LVAVQIQAEYTGLAEEDKQPLAVSGRRAGRVTVIGTFALVIVFRQLWFVLLVLRDRTVFAVQAQQMPHQVFLITLVRFESVTRVTRNEHTLAKRNRTRRARTRQFGFLHDVF
jgi:hypothetical protein